jgi:hypothetical protein
VFGMVWSLMFSRLESDRESCMALVLENAGEIGLFCIIFCLVKRSFSGE